MIVLLLASCARPGPTPAPSATGASPTAAAGRVACGTVTIAVNPWVGSEADAAVVGYLLEHRLGCTVVKRQLDELASWQFLASGGVDVILENWDHADLAATYVAKDEVARDAGPTGNEGVIGWFVPRYVVDAHPDILSAAADPQVLNRHLDLFRTAASGDRGQILDGDPGFVTQDEAMIAGFGLDYTVVHSGSEAASERAIQAAVNERRPILAYFVTPNWFSTKVDLVHVALPAFRPGCNADPARIACDYPRYVLYKVVSTTFATSGSPAFELIRRFTWTNEDQDLVAAAIVDEHLSDDAAAKRWLDANVATWRAWLP